MTDEVRDRTKSTAHSEPREPGSNVNLVMWAHNRVDEETFPANKEKVWTNLCSISWLEKLAGIAAIVCIVSLMLSSLPFMPVWYTTNVGWVVVPFFPLVFLGKDAIISWISLQLLCVERRLRRTKRPKRIILVRHGMSMANVDPKLYQTVPDNKIELTEQGREQALRAGENLRTITGKERVRFYVSPYVRSLQTWENIIKGGNWRKGEYTMREDPRLREQDWGNFQDPQDMEIVTKQRRIFGSFYYRMPNGESGADVFDRVTTVWDSIHREFASSPIDNYVLVTHGLTIRLFLMRYFQWTVVQFNELWNPHNCQLAVMELQVNGKYRLWGQQDWENLTKPDLSTTTKNKES